MSNGNMNKADMNCANAINKNSCSFDQTRFNQSLKNKNAEFAAENNPNLQSHRASLANGKFKPNNEQMPESERSAWN